MTKVRQGFSMPACMDAWAPHGRRMGAWVHGRMGKMMWIGVHVRRQGPMQCGCVAACKGDTGLGVTHGVPHEIMSHHS